MEIFINEISLHGQYADEKDFKTAITTFMSVFDLVHQKKAMAYKNLEILFQRQAIQHKDFTSSFESIKDQSFKQAFKQIVFNKNNPKDWTLQKVQKAEDVYRCEAIDDFVNDTTLAEVAARNRLDRLNRVLIHFKPSHFKESPIEIHRNEEIEPNLLDFVETRDEFQQWTDRIVVTEPKILIENGTILWLEREIFFPNLIFCKNVRKMIENFNSSMPAFVQITQRLFELETYAVGRGNRFNPDHLPTKISPESVTRLNDFAQELTWECPDGIHRTFSWHSRYTPGAGRIHFYPLMDSNKIIIGSIANQNSIK